MLKQLCTAVLLKKLYSVSGSKIKTLGDESFKTFINFITSDHII